MTAFLIAGGCTAAALVILGAFLRWAVKPLLASFRLGQSLGLMLAAQAKDDEPKPPPHPALEAAFYYLMPWHAGRRIRSLERQRTLLVRTLGYAVADAPGPLKAIRPERNAWYDRPMPFAVAMALLRPARAVRKLRSTDTSLVYVLDAMVAQHRKHAEAEQQLVAH